MASDKYNQIQEALKKAKLYDELKPKYEELQILNKKNIRLVSPSEKVYSVITKPTRGGPLPKLLPDDYTMTRIADMAMLGATDREMAGCLKVSEATWIKFKNEYPEVMTTIDSSRNEGKLSLRRIQWTQAQNNPSMAIWLGKNELGQSDKLSTENTINVNVLKSLMELPEDDELEYIETSSEVLRDDDEE